MTALRAERDISQREHVGGAGASVRLQHLGAAADYEKLHAEFGSTAERAARPARASLAMVTAADGLK
jgi:transketolase